MKIKSILLTDLIAIALAGIISLLFTREVSFFVETGSKKNTEYAAAAVVTERSGTTDQFFISKLQFGMRSPMNAVNHVNMNFLWRVEFNKNFKALFVGLAAPFQKRWLEGDVPSYEKIRQALAAGPSIPIFQRKLLL